MIKVRVLHFIYLAQLIQNLLVSLTCFRPTAERRLEILSAEA